MAYEISSSRKLLEAQLKAIAQRLTEADKKGVSPGLRDYTIAAAVFLSHAELENYFTDALGRLAKAYSKFTPNSAALPPRLRAHLVTTTLNLEVLAGKIASRVGEPEVLGTVEKWFTSPALALLDATKAVTQFDGASIYGDFSYPSERNIEKVFRRLGVGDPKGAINAEAKADAFSLLASIAALRTALAHSGTLPGVSCSDVKNRMKGLMVFVRSVDRVLYLHARKFMSHDQWKLGMC